MCICKHNNSHKIINYNDKEYICNIDNEKYNSYCKECKKNICILCENKHNNHELISYGKLIIEEDKIIKKKEEIKKEIDLFNNNIKEEIRKLNKIIENIEGYYKIIDNIITKYFTNKKRNYQILININNLINNNSIIKNIKNIDIKKYNDILDIYNKIYNNNDKDKDIDNNKRNDLDNDNNNIVHKKDENKDEIKIVRKKIVNKNNIKFGRSSTPIKFPRAVTPIMNYNAKNSWLQKYFIYRHESLNKYLTIIQFKDMMNKLQENYRKLVNRFIHQKRQDNNKNILTQNNVIESRNISNLENLDKIIQNKK